MRAPLLLSNARGKGNRLKGARALFCYCLFELESAMNLVAPANTALTSQVSVNNVLREIMEKGIEDTTNLQ